MNFLFLILQEHAAEAESPNVFEFTTNVSVWTLIIFLLLLGVLYKFAYPHILGYAAAREKRIQDALDESKRNREESERLLEAQRQELARARAEAQQLVAEGRQAAEKVRQDLLARARTEQEELLTRAKAEIEAERARAVESMRREAVDLALAAAAKLLEERLDADTDRRLVNDFLSRVQRTAPAGAAG
ncbi:MAG TPA: F0F1 ATP synthase subunit B [Longimicrobiales bacterium]|nr:F0F1 ATP synthase subunit B [Longimicrobiales bacterium]